MNIQTDTVKITGDLRKLGDTLGISQMTKKC